MTDAVQIVLAKRPAGDVTADCFRRETIKLPALADGQVLIRSRFLSLDPYMRPRMTETRSYVPPFELDKPLTGNVTPLLDAGLDRFNDLIDGRIDRLDKRQILIRLYRRRFNRRTLRHQRSSSIRIP